MKKNLLILAAALMAITSSYAQTAKSSKTELAKLPKVQVKGDVCDTRLQAVEMKEGALLRAPKKSAATGLYYTKPAGAMYANFDWNNMGYYPTFLYVQAWNKFTFENMSDVKTGNTWTMDWSGIRDGGEEIDVTDNADENGNYSSSLSGGYYTLAPTLHNAEKTDAFALGYNTNDDYYKDGAVVNPKYCTQIRTSDDVITMGFIDDHSSNGYGFGSLDTGYLYGSGAIDRQDSQTGEVDHRVAWGVRQEYPKPMSPLYVEAITTNFVSAYEDPIPGGEGLELTMYILDITDPENPTVKATLKANEESLVVRGSSNVQYTETGEYYYGKIKFSNTQFDVLGTEYDEPFVIDYPFFVQIEGLDQEGISIGFTCLEIPEEDALDLVEPTYFLVTSESTGDKYRHYYTDCTIRLQFVGMMDNCFVWEDVEYQDGTTVENFNFIRMSEDGTTSIVENDLSTEEKLPGVIVETAAPWYDEEKNEYYYIDELPEWVWGCEALTMDDYGHKSCLKFTCDPLPEGENGRYAEVRVAGRGITSGPIYILQGNITIEEVIAAAAISSPEASVSKKSRNTGRYNLAGQKVSKDFKGIVIENGKKIVK